MIATPEKLSRISGIYCAIHRASGMCYVGSTLNMAVRLNAHLNSAKRGSTTTFHRALREFGPPSFDFEVLERCDKSQLLSREQFYIALMGAATINGFNTCAHAHAVYGTAHNAATRERQRAAKLGRKLTDEHRAKLRIAKRSKKGPLSAAHRAALSLAHKTSPACIAHWDRTHAGQVGMKQSAEVIAKRSASLTGKKRGPFSEAHKAAMSAGWAARRQRLSAQFSALKTKENQQ